MRSSRFTALTPRRGTPPGQGGIQILAAAMMADGAFLRPLVSGSHLFFSVLA